MIDGVNHLCEEDPDALVARLARQKLKTSSERLSITPNEGYRIVLEELQLEYPNIVPRFG